MMKTILIEDEINARDALKKMLHIIEPSIQIVAETSFVAKAIELIKMEKPDLIFLDIQLEDGTGFDILKQLEPINAKIIFTTAYSKYAINAFKFSAIDYLLKPIDPVELKEAINRALEGIDSERNHQELIEVLKNNEKSAHKKIVLKTTEQKYIILISNVIYLKADGAYTIFITSKQKIIVSKNIKFYQNLLDDTLFIRCHQSYLVNLKHVIGVDKASNLQMTNNDLVAISTRKKTQLIQLINKL